MNGANVTFGGKYRANSRKYRSVEGGTITCIHPCFHLQTLQKATGMSTYDFAKKHRFQPLDIEDSYSGIERKPVQDTSRSFELVFLFTETFYMDGSSVWTRVLLARNCRRYRIQTPMMRMASRRKMLLYTAAAGFASGLSFIVAVITFWRCKLILPRVYSRVCQVSSGSNSTLCFYS